MFLRFKVSFIITHLMKMETEHRLEQMELELHSVIDVLWQ